MKFVGFTTVHMRVHVSMKMGLIYKSFMAVSTKKVWFGLVFSNHMSSQGVFSSAMRKNTDHILLFIFVLIYDMTLQMVFFLQMIYRRQWSYLNVVVS